jgi:hypothetical protein
LADEVRIKKVNAYPFAVQIKFETSASVGQIVKLTQSGFLAEISLNALQPGEKFECTFELPVSHAVITEPCVLIKLYNQWGAGEKTSATGTEAKAPAAPPPVVSAGVSTPAAAGLSIQRLAEVHFVNLKQDNWKKITAFLGSMNKGKTS